MLFCFRLAIFLGAGLLFLIQPMFAKMVLPVLGGSPAVWNTCMLFFQGLLLAGYAYVHVGRQMLGERAQIVVHMLILMAALFVPSLYLSKEWTPPDSDTPIFWLLGILFIVVGAPFFAVSATGPLLQQWFASTRHQRAGNPYFLYVASNAGSIIALLAYPFLIERILAVENQTRLWKYTYIAFVVSMGICVIFVFKDRKSKLATAPTTEDENQSREGTVSNADVGAVKTVTWWDRLFWIGLAFVPSSWMLGVTTFLTTDISPMPILWIIPLSIYLLTFIIAFSDQPILSSDWMLRLFPVSMLILVATSIFKGGFLIMGFHLVIFFFGAMMCHFELAKRKPDAKRLTEFYFWISLGGLLGGIFNGLVAPLMFSWVLEYPLTLMLACVLCPTFAPKLAAENSASGQSKLQSTPNRSSEKPRKSPGKKKKQRREMPVTNSTDPDDLQRKLKLGTFVIFILTLAILANTLPFEGTSILAITTMLGLAGMCLCFFLNRPVLFALPLGLVLIIAKLEPIQPGETVIFTSRGFFGVNRVVEGPLGAQKRLYHGTTVHGIQGTDPQRPDLHLKPMSYYHETGPLGMIFRDVQQDRPFRQVGIVGLGAGTAAYYCRPGQHFTFFEIDPIVKRIAEDPKFFTFLEACGKENYDIFLGDGRLKLAQQPDGQFDLLVFDAFSSDAIPIHLITKEAIKLYLTKLTDDGLMAFHISNKYFDLEPILGDIAHELKLDSIVCHDILISDEEMDEGKAAASYVVLARDLSTNPLNKRDNWRQAARSRRKHVWTDDFSNVFDALK